MVDNTKTSMKNIFDKGKSFKTTFSIKTEDSDEPHRTTIEVRDNHVVITDETEGAFVILHQEEWTEVKTYVDRVFKRLNK